MFAVYIDGDACPMRSETYRVAKRHQAMVWVVANQWMDMPNDPTIRLEVVNDGFDAADDWIVERVKPGDVVITDDIPLASRSIEKGALVLTNRGDIRDANSIGEALAMRELMQYMRASGEVRGGNKPIDDQDRRLFQQQLEKLIHVAKKLSANR